MIASAAISSMHMRGADEVDTRHYAKRSAAGQGGHAPSKRGLGRRATDNRVAALAMKRGKSVDFYRKLAAAYCGLKKPGGTWRRAFCCQLSFLGLLAAISLGRNCNASLSRFRKYSIEWCGSHSSRKCFLKSARSRSG
jgi:hypothetical protein